MAVCWCSLAGTAACQHCYNNPYAIDVGTSITTDHIEVKVPGTNADRFRGMTDEELASSLFDVSNYACPPGKEFTTLFCGKNPDCKKCWLGWLKQEVQE